MFVPGILREETKQAVDQAAIALFEKYHRAVRFLEIADYWEEAALHEPKATRYGFRYILSKSSMFQMRVYGYVYTQVNDAARYYGLPTRKNLKDLYYYRDRNEGRIARMKRQAEREARMDQEMERKFLRKPYKHKQPEVEKSKSVRFQNGLVSCFRVHADLDCYCTVTMHGILQRFLDENFRKGFAVILNVHNYEDFWYDILVEHVVVADDVRKVLSHTSWLHEVLVLPKADYGTKTPQIESVVEIEWVQGKPRKTRGKHTKVHRS